MTNKDLLYIIFTAISQIPDRGVNMPLIETYELRLGSKLYYIDYRPAYMSHNDIAHGSQLVDIHEVSRQHGSRRLSLPIDEKLYKILLDYCDEEHLAQNR